MIFGYARVSTKNQAVDGNSIEAQTRLLKENGAERIYSDIFTGKIMERPQFISLMDELKEGDTLIVTKLDRFARSASEGIKTVEQLCKKGVKVNVLNMGILDDSPSGKLMRNVMLCFAEFERDMIIQRTQEGREIARQKEGYRDGRKPLYSSKQLEHALSLLSSHSYKEISEMTGISKSTLIRAKRRTCSKKLTT